MWKHTGCSHHIKYSAREMTSPIGQIWGISQSWTHKIHLYFKYNKSFIPKIIIGSWPTIDSTVERLLLVTCVLILDAYMHTSLFACMHINIRLWVITFPFAFFLSFSIFFQLSFFIYLLFFLPHLYHYLGHVWKPNNLRSRHTENNTNMGVMKMFIPELHELMKMYQYNKTIKH